MNPLKLARRMASGPPLHLLSRFFLADVAFTFLPLGIIAVLRRSLGEFNTDFYSLPEWSFAAIIVHGIAMTRVLELKMRYQKDTSERVFVLMRVCILGLIAAVISLSLSQMQQAGLSVSMKCLLVLQFAVLAHGLFILGLSHYAREAFVRERSVLPAGLEIRKFFRFIVDDLEDVRDELDNLANRFKKRVSAKYDNSDEQEHWEDWVRQRTRYIDHLITDCEGCFERLKEARSEWDTTQGEAQQSPAGDVLKAAPEE